jgi:RNA polymerase sigma factor (sigma-70 family)
MSEEQDRDLVAACMTGDVRAFGRLVERHHGAVTSIAFAITRDLALAEDIAQETFVIAWTRLGELRDAARVRAWLCNIARNKSKNELRGLRARVELPAEVADATPSVVDAAVAREAEVQLRAALAEIPDAYREPLVLFYWQEQSIASVASALDITEQAAQKRISRARSYVHDELASRFDETGRGRRAAKVAATAVVAVLATRATPVAAAGAGKAGWFAIKVFAIIAIGLVGVAGIAHQLATRGASASSRSSTVPTGAAAAPSPSAATRAAPAPALAGAPAAQSTASDKPGTGGYPVPKSYEITELAQTSIAVNLAGGRSGNYLFQDPDPPTFSRHVRGRVVDVGGKPIAGAVVVIGDRLGSMFGSLQGDGGATTNASGAFDAIVHTDEALNAIALHEQAGWTPTVAVPAGRGDAEIVIRGAGRGGLSGTVRRGGKPIDADVIITGRGTLALMLDTDASGRFAVPLLAPGHYRVTARTSQLFAGGASKGVEQEVDIAAGKPVEVALELPAGVLVVVNPGSTEGLSTIEYFLVPGVDLTYDFAKLRQLGRDRKALETLFGGQDVDRPMQFHDVAPGDYTLCVDRRISRDEARPLVCKKLTVPQTKPLVEVDL